MFINLSKSLMCQSLNIVLDWRKVLFGLLSNNKRRFLSSIFATYIHRFVSLYLLPSFRQFHKCILPRTFLYTYFSAKKSSRCLLHSFRELKLLHQENLVNTEINGNSKVRMKTFQSMFNYICLFPKEIFSLELSRWNIKPFLLTNSELFSSSLYSNPLYILKIFFQSHHCISITLFR